MNDAKPGDIYADKDGTLWRVVAKCNEPTVDMERVEPDPPRNPQWQPMGGMGMAGAQNVSPTLPLYRPRIGGSVSGLMWEGFKRIYRKESP